MMGKPKSTRTAAEPGAEQIQALTNPPSEAEVEALRNFGATLDTHSKQFEQILQAIRDTKNTLEAKIDTVALDVGILRADHRKLADRVSEME